jgi:hypothetical protein
VQYLNANHRDICKFDNPDDPNYITLKNAIISVTQDLLRDGISPPDYLCTVELAYLSNSFSVRERSV